MTGTQGPSFSANTVAGFPTYVRFTVHNGNIMGISVSVHCKTTRPSLRWLDQTRSRRLILSLPSSTSTFSQPFREKCISEVVRIGYIIVPSGQAMKSHVLQNVWCNISGEATGKI